MPNQPNSPAVHKFTLLAFDFSRVDEIFQRSVRHPMKEHPLMADLQLPKEKHFVPVLVEHTPQYLSRLDLPTVFD